MDRRSHRRFFTEVLASYRIGDGETQSTFISDISAAGCRFADYHSSLEVGDAVELILPGLEPLQVTVVWTNRRAAGVEFQVKLEATVVEHFAAYCSSAA